jgi:hypothetical protein
MHVITKTNSYQHSSEATRFKHALNSAIALGIFGGRNIYLVDSNYQENHDNFMRFLFDGEPGPGPSGGGRKKMKRRNTAKTKRNRKQCGTKKHKCYKNRKRY